MVQAMDEDENKMGLKRKSKHIGSAVDSGDDEPIGTLLKLKGKRNSKRSKVAADGSGKKVKGVENMATDDDELGGMNDTLAIFRKKLKGPKKDGGSAVAAVKELSSNVSEPLCHSLDEPVKGWESDSNLISEAKGRCLGRNEGESSGDATIVESTKGKTKVKNKRSKVNPDAKIIENSGSNGLCCDTSGNDASQQGKEVASVSGGEALEDSLSVFFQKVQSGMIAKSRNSSRLKPEKEALVSDDGAYSGADSEALVEKPLYTSKLVQKALILDDNCGAASGKGSLKAASVEKSVDDCLLPEDLNCTLGNPADSIQELFSCKPDSNDIRRSTDYEEDSSTKVILEKSAFFTSVQNSASSLRTELGDGKIKCKSIEDPLVLGNAPLDSNNFLNRKNEVLCCVEAKDLGTCEGMSKTNGDVKRDSLLDNDLFPSYSGQVQLHSSPSTFDSPHKEHHSGDLDGPVTVLGKCFEEVDLQPFSSRGADDQVSECRSSPSSASENNKYEVVFRKVVTESETLETSHVLVEGECLPNCDDPSAGEEINGTLYSSIMLDHQGTCGKDSGCLADPETKDSTLTVGQRAARNAKKQRHGDMAYEGDIDWDVLIQSQELFGSHRVDKTREKLNPLSTVVDAESGKAAAVAAGLKARAVGPLEKIKFKEVLKRKGGLQEYLECRSVYPITSNCPLFLNPENMNYMVFLTRAFSKC